MISILNNQDKILAELFRAIDQNGYLQGDVAEDIVDDVVAQNQFSPDEIEKAEHYLHYEYLKILNLTTATAVMLQVK